MARMHRLIHQMFRQRLGGSRNFTSTIGSKSHSVMFESNALRTSLDGVCEGSIAENSLLTVIRLFH